jgi:hypothetical protein
MAQLTAAPTSDIAQGGTATKTGATFYGSVSTYPNTADPLTSYVQLGTTADSFFTCGFTAFSVPANSVINYVEVQYYDEEPASGNNSSTGRIRVNTTDYDHGTTHNVSTTTTARTKQWTTNPAGGNWTVDQVNNVGGTGLNAFGVIGPDSNPIHRVGAIRIVVDYTPPISGTSSGSLGNLSGTATGTVMSERTGTSSVSLGNLSGTATGVLERFASSSASLGSVSGTATGTVQTPTGPRTVVHYSDLSPIRVPGRLYGSFANKGGAAGVTGTSAASFAVGAVSVGQVEIAGAGTTTFTVGATNVGQAEVRGASQASVVHSWGNKATVAVQAATSYTVDLAGTAAGKGEKPVPLMLSSVPPARPTVMFGMMPASNWTSPGSEMFSATAEPLPSARRESAAELPSAVALKLPV